MTARPRFQLPSARFALAIAALLAIGCGDRERRSDSGTPGAGSSGPSGALQADSAADSIPAPVAPFASACFEGDPAAGATWRLIGADTASTRLASVGIEDLVTRDSARLAARIASAADALPNDTTGGDFHGLPVVVQAAWRVLAGEGETLFVARTVRRLPIESAPLEEMTHLVAMPTTRAGTRATIAVLWSSREVAAEESADPMDLAVAISGANGPMILFVRSADDPPHAELVTRQDLRWTRSWSGVLPRCSGP